ncbi:MAG: aminotransferase class I/II-fold pyridoxal phosphate-dependent enzyme [Lachnoclostridium sp.]|nr:aminotransferase class I/II-fold pyridoxal phosphate-dependent enzyme [Lachnospira sp.]MCM1247213.1 aminotransferase class I/II-fold pyridoxal phosphate-dependent enzyme [Lachnoclostridium sp.]MCM1534566.1 aminotransferase class I/II-fold pyridoxal phosphate-dependent enzyme [Clostridium sp.]
MQGLILAAGMGKRLKDLTQNNTKCMIKVNGVTLIERMLRQLERLHLSRVVIVVGYEGKKLIDYIDRLGIRTPICYVDNPVYDRTNNIYSLSLAKEYLLKEDTLLLESDIIFEDSVLQILMDDSRQTLALVDKYESWMDGTCVKIGEDDSIDSFIPGRKFVFEDIRNYYKTVNIYKFSRHFSEKYYVPFLDAYSKALGDNEYYEQVLRVITMLDDPEIKAKKLTGQLWYEIDDIQDLDIASSMFADDADEKTAGIQTRYGGYWRYPHLLDFCYLVNPYFPPQKMMDELKASFETLLTQYPSGMKVNSLLAAKNFDVHKEHILVGNGAAELIKCLMESLTGKIGFIRPTFEEYPNRCKEADRVVYNPQNENLAYKADDLIQYFDGMGIDTLILINPDNPSGNYIEKADVLRIAGWCGEKQIRFIVDESFVDFAEEKNATLIDEEIIHRYRNLIILKSISKSYGVPGLRLGIMVSADEELIACMKKEAAIWNINSFGEFYMQIAEKYKKDYTDALEKIRAARRQLSDELAQIPGIRVVPSQANYFLIEITNGITAKELTQTLLLHYNILIKDLSEKIKLRGRQFVRIAVRNSEDNGKLIDALKKIMCRL